MISGAVIRYTTQPTYPYSVLGRSDLASQTTRQGEAQWILSQKWRDNIHVERNHRRTRSVLDPILPELRQGSSAHACAYAVSSSAPSVSAGLEARWGELQLGISRSRSSIRPGTIFQGVIGLFLDIPNGSNCFCFPVLWKLGSRINPSSMMLQLVLGGGMDGQRRSVSTPITHRR
ncbi:hypothetical protein LZ30DRAFT_133238 [Colletotrichum cereale]|nr:hypothetical protein LZ30DRAFT_133238 [Colletotrichum cereale]